MADVPLCKCGAVATRADDATRCSQGHTLAGHAGPALRHGQWSVERGLGAPALPPPLRQTVASVEDFRAQIVADLGGESELSAIEAGYVRRLTELETVARLLAANLAEHGLVTKRGRVRNVHLRWLATVQVWDRVAGRIGLRRRERRLDTLESLAAEIVASRETP